MTTIFMLVDAIVLAAGLGVSAYRVSVGRRQAKGAAESPRRATLRALSGEDDDLEEPDDRAP